MSYRHILVQTGARASDLPRLDLAADLARRYDAGLTGVSVTAPPIWRTVVPGPEVASPAAELAELDAQQETREGVELELSAEALRTAARRLQLEPALRTVPDDISALTALARAADLTVLPAPGDASAAAGATPEDVALGSGGPVLIVPEGWSPGPVGERVLVAWDGSAEAARALKGALPILARAAEIDVVIVDRDPAVHEAEITVPEYLSRHGCKARARRVSSVDRPVGEVLLREAQQLGADMIVMGLYGHSRLREAILGGASRQLLQQARVPLLMSH